MRQMSRAKVLSWLVRFLVACVVQAGAGMAHADAADANSAASLRARYAELRAQLNQNEFQRPIYLSSTQSSGDLKGDIFALVDHSFATVNAALKEATHWCDILILHVNTKYCRASTGPAQTILTVSIGRKYDQPLDKAHRVDFTYHAAAATADYLQVLLNAEVGPVSTRNYRIMLEAVPLEGARTFIHLSYSYDYGLAGRVAMQVYLSTTGSGKVGFTVTGRQSDGQPTYIGGVRGVVERNTMRYYLAIESYLGALSAPPQARLEKRLRDWFAAIERYPRQLHEMEQSEYLDMKRKEYRRQQAGVQAAFGASD